MNDDERTDGRLAAWTFYLTIAGVVAYGGVVFAWILSA